MNSNHKQKRKLKNLIGKKNYIIPFSFIGESFVSMEVIDQDDIFFADLSKQISLLIMEDDDNIELAVSAYRHPSASLQPFSGVIHPRPPSQSQMFYEQSCKRVQSKGTGVFIPRSTQPRRKNKQGRFTTRPSNTKFQKHSDSNSRGLPHCLASNNYNYSFNHIRS